MVLLGCGGILIISYFDVCMKKLLGYFVLLLLMALLLNGCGMYTSYEQINHTMNSLELGASKQEVIPKLPANYSYVARELVGDMSREVIGVKSYESDRTWSSVRGEPIIYFLIFENNRLVAVDTKIDFAEKRAEEIRRAERAEEE